MALLRLFVEKEEPQKSHKKIFEFSCSQKLFFSTYFFETSIECNSKPLSIRYVYHTKYAREKQYPPMTSVT